METLTPVRKQKFAVAISILLTGLLAACRTVGDSGSGRLNCGLEAPPATSGEMSSEGGEMRVFPRATAMSKRYSGCQTVWGVNKSNNVARFMLERHYVDGSVTELRVVDSGPEDKICKYNKATLVAGPSSCPTFALANKREASLPPGCLNTLANSKVGPNEPCFQQYK